MSSNTHGRSRARPAAIPHEAAEFEAWKGHVRAFVDAMRQRLLEREQEVPEP